MNYIIKSRIANVNVTRRTDIETRPVRVGDIIK